MTKFASSAWPIDGIFFLLQLLILHELKLSKRIARLSNKGWASEFLVVFLTVRT